MKLDTDDHDQVRFHVMVNCWLIWIFIALGIFGHFNILFIYSTCKGLHAKPVYLQCILSVSHLLILFVKMPDAYFLPSPFETNQILCLAFYSPYIFLTMFQSIFYTMMLLDTVVLISFPIFHRKIRVLNYILIVTLMPSIYSMLIIVFGFQTVSTDDVSAACTIGTGMSDILFMVYLYSITWIIGGDIILFIVLLIIVKFRTTERALWMNRVLMNLFIQMSFFVFIWLITIFYIIICDSLSKCSSKMIFIFSNYLFTISLLIYAQPFYVLLWKSNEFRKEFLKIYQKIGRIKKIEISVIPIVVQ